MKAQTFLAAILVLVLSLSINISRVNAEEINPGYLCLMDENIEEIMEVEAWMMDESYWEADARSFTLVEEIEKQEVEDWMLDNDFWK